MSRRSQHPHLSDLPAIEDDPALFDPSPMWFIPGLKESLRETAEPDDGLGLRALFERPEALSQDFSPTVRPPRRRPRRSKFTPTNRDAPVWPRAA